MGELIGYARVSSSGQNLESQIEALHKAGCTKIYQEKQSGKEAKNREQLQTALDYVRDGDTFIVTRIDRMARSSKDLHNILAKLDEKGVGFKCTEQALDTTTSNGKLMIAMLGAVAEFETDLRAERQADGIKSALARGVKFGKKAITLTQEQLDEAISLKDDGLTSQEVANKFGIARSTLLKKIKEYKELK
jgi:DNA invertase Pin-like site-specific DNA recombinase